MQSQQSSTDMDLNIFSYKFDSNKIWQKQIIIDFKNTIHEYKGITIPPEFLETTSIDSFIKKEISMYNYLILTMKFMMADLLFKFESYSLLNQTQSQIIIDLEASYTPV